MPRQPRIQFEGACYHVFHRGNRRERIYWDEKDYARFEAIMLETADWSGVKLLTWSQMPNHFHQLVETPEGNLAEYMSRLLSRFAMYFNRVHHLVGHVFQGRYGAVLCDKESYFMELIRYIQLNPYRTKGKALSKLGDWKWASHRYLMMPESQWPGAVRQAFQDVMARFGSDLQTARQNYARFLAEGLEQGTWEDFYKVKGERFLGNDRFIEKVKLRTDEPVRKSERFTRQPNTIHELMQMVSEISGHTPDLLSSASRKANLNGWRKGLVYIGRKVCRFPVRVLAAAIGRDASAASQILRRLDGESESNREIKKLLEALRD
jgi:putative transposase